MLNSFKDLKEMLVSRSEPKHLAVVCAHDDHSLTAVVKAAKEKLVSPILIGKGKEICNLLKTLEYPVSDTLIFDVESDVAAAEKAAELVRTGVANCLMKGGIQTGTLMKVLLSKETGIEKKGVMTMMALMQSPYYHKVFALTDIGLLTYPDVNQKKAAIENAVNAFHKLGVDMPKVAVLAAVEKENPKMKETVDAQLLKNMDIDGCYVEGPISFDLAMDPNAAAIKGYSSRVAGDADILLVPDICSGNIAAKTLTCCGGAETCGAVLGAQVPIVISSRSAPVQDKYMSIILNALIS